jgi:hypothetical protein
MLDGPGAVVGRVRDLVIGLAPGLLGPVVTVPPMPQVVVVRRVTLGARRRIVAEEVAQQPPQPVHRNGL